MKISVVGCSDYTFDKVKENIISSFEQLGGIGKYIEKGDRVLLKVNLVMKKHPDEAATSHPVFVGAIAQVLTDYGAEVLIGDSPGGLFHQKALLSVYKVCQMDRAAELGNAQLNYDTGFIDIDNENGVILKSLTVARMALAVDKIISVCMLKTHGMMKLTGAVKNMFGIIPGTKKAEYHFQFPDTENFADGLIDICQFANPVLSFMDAIIAMEGNGPTAGMPRKIGCIIAGESPYEVDFAAARLVQADIMSIPVLKQSVKRNLIHPYGSQIIWMGEMLKHFAVQDFIMPESKSMHFLGSHPPKALVWLAERFLMPRPAIQISKCIGCGDCAQNCPPHTIQMKHGKPEIGYRSCIRCYCCQELCPQKAVAIYRPFLLRLFSKLHE